MQKELEKAYPIIFGGPMADYRKKQMTPYQLECLKHPLSREEAMAQIQRNHRLAQQRQNSKRKEKANASERSDAVSGNSSSGELSLGDKARLSHYSSTSPIDEAKV